MRNEQLKNELNSRSQDFDREALWKDIDQARGKKKRRILFWFFGGTALVLASLLFFSQKNLLLENPSITSIPNNDQELLPTTPIQSKTNEIQDPFIDSDEKSIVQPENKRSLSETTLKTSSTLVEQDKMFKTQVSQSKFAAENKELPKVSDSREALHTRPVSVGNVNDPSGNGLVLKQRPLITAVWLPWTKPQIFRRDKETFDVYPLVKEMEVLPSKKWMFGVSVLGSYGKTRHLFASNSMNREKEEVGLESISTMLTGYVRVQNWHFYTGALFVSHNTRLKSIQDEYQILEGVNSTTFRNTYTTYTLYNSYQYLDLILGMGYRISLSERWSIQPELQIGYSMSFLTNGEILQDGNLITLSSFEPYLNHSKWQGQANFKLSRALGKYWSIGIAGYWRTNKVLAEQEEEIHKVSDYGLGVALSRNF